MNWIDVMVSKPKCSKNPNALGIPVLIWPRNPDGDLEGIDGQAYFGKRATGYRACFYKYGKEIFGVTHWMPMPDGP